MSRSTRTINVNGPARGASRSFAQVFDNYVAPARGKSSLHALGAALSTVGSAVSAEEARAREEQRRNDERQGMLEGLSLSLHNDPAKIKAGEMFPQASQAFMAGLRQSQAQAWAYEQLRTWQGDYQAWDGRDSNDPAAYTTWMQERLSEARKAIGTDEFAIAGALPVLQQGINNMSAQHTAYTADRVKSDDLTAMRETSLGVMETHDWLSDPTGIDLMDKLAAEADLRVARGLDGTAVNQTLVNDMLAFADAHNDMNVLAALAAAHDDGTYRLNAEQMKQVDDMRLNIENELDQVAADEAAAAKRQEDKDKAEYLQSFQTSLLENPLSMPDPSLPTDIYKSALNLRSVYNQAADRVDPQLEEEALIKLNATIYHPDFQKLSYADKMKQIAPLLADPSVTLSQGTIGTVFRLLGAQDNPASPVNNTTISKLRTNTVAAVKTFGGGIVSMGNENALAVAFESQYNRYLMEYDLEGKTPIEIRSIHDELTAAIMGDLMADTDTRFQLLDAISDNPALARQFGLQDYMREYYANNPDQQAADELDLLNEPEPIEDEDNSIIENVVDFFSGSEE